MYLHNVGWKYMYPYNNFLSSDLCQFGEKGDVWLCLKISFDIRKKNSFPRLLDVFVFWKWEGNFDSVQESDNFSHSRLRANLISSRKELISIERIELHLHFQKFIYEKDAFWYTLCIRDKIPIETKSIHEYAMGVNDTKKWERFSLSINQLTMFEFKSSFDVNK